MPESFDALIPYVGQALGLPEPALLSAFRPATPADLPAILSLRQRVTPEMWWNDEAFVRWRYFSRRSSDNAMPYWVFAKDDGVIAACGLEPITLVVDGAPFAAVRSLDIMVHPDVDGLGLGAFINVMLFRHFPIIIVTGSNDRSHHLLSRMFHHAADLVFWKALAGSRHFIGDPSAQSMPSRIFAVTADRLLALVRWGRRLPPPPGVRIRELPAFDERVTDLSRRCERQGRVIVRRSAEYLNWRFFKNPRCAYRAFGAFTGERLDGYVVARLNTARPNPRREGEIVDWLSSGDPEDRLSTLPSLVAEALRGLADAGAGLITCAAHGADIAPAAEANGFHFREGQRIPFFVKASSAAMHHRLASRPGWFLTRGDLDVE